MKKKLVIIVNIFILIFFLHTQSISANTFLKLETLRKNKEQLKTLDEISRIIENQSYPSYYGGAYISDDSTHVVLQIVKENIPLTTSKAEYAKFRQITSIDNNLEIKYVNNSYKKLNEINDKLVEYFSSEKADISNLGSHYVDAFKNVVVVELLNNQKTKVNKLKNAVFADNPYMTKTLDSNVIVFTNGKEQINNAKTLKAGQEISTSDGLCSMGYRVKIGGKAGYITAGHCFSRTGQTSTGGKVTKYKESGKVDAAFVQTTSSYSPSNSLYYTNGSITTLNNTLCPFLRINQVIAKAGRTTGYTIGKIKNLNYSAKYDGIYFTGLIAADYQSKGGDSGGPVFVPSNTGGGGAPLAGINKGSSSYGTAFVNADEIYLAFGYKRY